eukprot:CAMPEP_0205820286 /NCGR_PEP_ID=MMETSP0206-20130828/2894_1 /ASSEMBLY_ACC=CAM_ASM_000279 /TAXON_ID=36767 /ORGANISM="Euplotes focardii, Strain TN1" /LENGTH=236 /DNA_ID=CAMNT_0053114833 /DNA_START=116 /DNA_END=826 /DNA_ORIENTATION=+
MTVPKSSRDYERFSCGRHQPTVLPDYSPDEEHPQADVLAEIQGNPGGNPELRTIIVELDGNQDILTQFSDETASEVLSRGNWTMVIFEGLSGFFYDATIEEDISFNSFWRYNRISDDEYETDCTQTILGWHHTVNPENEDEEQWGCFWGEKISGPYTAQSIHFRDGSPVLSENSDSSEHQTCNQLIQYKDDNNDLTWLRGNKGNSNAGANVARDNPFANGGSEEQQGSEASSDQAN